MFEVENPAPERRVKGKTKQAEMQENNEPVHKAEIYANRVLTTGRHIMPEDFFLVRGTVGVHFFLCFFVS